MTEGDFSPQTYISPPSTPAKPKKWPWILGIIAAFGIGIAIGSAGGNTKAPTSAQPNSGGNASETAAITTGSVPPQADTAKELKPPSGPKTEFGDGTYLVGTDIEAGSYKTTGPRAGSVIPTCYWARLKNDSGEVSAIIASDLGQGATRITVKKGEYLKISGCDFTKG